ncbi:mitochondrial 37S ribosomal protein [Starmerella bacillaris]|uniref:Mitochondrial 37S ribosomal protein n=1 Tax=Starmerella bacillaris TaxID=1247836 RepID=A0AAV5RHV2_STABA|nr:mitochondrial 37S ribosomal protein [Starmerella bacillaris]
MAILKLKLLRSLGIRRFHQVPNIGLDSANGIKGLLSPEGLQIAWFDYQTSLLNRINESLDKIPELKKFDDLLSLHRACIHSGDPALKSLASLSGQAFNNEFFFKSLRTEGSVNKNATFKEDSRHVDISQEVLNMPRFTPAPEISETDTSYFVKSTPHPAYDAITSDHAFRSVSVFRESLIDRGASMIGNGAVWLVSSSQNSGILNTYGWGTPLSQEHENDVASQVVSPANTLSVYPVLGINLWEHIYLKDYGVAGKRKFMENCFDCIDWSVIDERIEEAK